METMEFYADAVARVARSITPMPLAVRAQKSEHNTSLMITTPFGAHDMVHVEVSMRRFIESPPTADVAYELAERFWERLRNLEDARAGIRDLVDQ